ncbi:MAG: polysaccharide biosynthesis C-terminal domain-containing protein [Pseudomonadota bacterium]
MSALRNIVATAALKFSTILFGLLTSVLLARLMGTSGFGVYAYVIACVTLIGLPLQAGLPTLITREVAGLNAVDDRKTVTGLVWRALQFLSIISAVVFCIALFTSGLQSLPVSAQHRSLFLAGGALIVLAAWTGFFGAALIGSGKLIAGQLPDAAIRPALFITFVATLALSGQMEATPSLVLHCAVAAASIAALIAAIRFYGEFRAQLRSLTPRYETQKWLNSMLPLAFFGVTTTLLTQTDLIILGIFNSAATVGVYKVSVVGSMLVAFGLSIVNTVNAPKYAARFTQKDNDGLETLAFDAARLATVFAVALFIVYLVFGAQILTIVFGDEYIGAYSVLIILAAAQLVNCFTGSVGLILNTTNSEGQAAKSLAVAAILNVALNLALIPRFGAIGAAIATGISLTVSNALMWFSVKTSIGINASAWPLIRR